MQRNEILRSYGKSYKDMTKKLLAEADLIGEIRGLKGRIGIKPNLVSPTPADFGGTTHPEIIAGIIEYLLENQVAAEKIVVLEGSWVGDKTSEAFDYCGYLSLSAKYGVELLDLQKEKRVDTVDCAGVDIHICSVARELGYLINVPVLKGHCQTKVTCALKNMKGVIPNSEKRRFHSMGLHKPIAHLNLGVCPDFIVIDHICGDPDFEEGGNPLVKNCVMAAKDPVLTDAYTCSVLGYSVDEVGYIRIAEKIGVGSADLSKAVIRTVEGTADENEPKDGSGGDYIANASAYSDTRKMVSISYAIDEIDSCSACFGALAPVLDRIKNEGNFDQLMELLDGNKIGIGQGYRGQKGCVGVGNCTSGFDFCVHGCPPKEEDIYQGLMNFIHERN